MQRLPACLQVRLQGAVHRAHHEHPTECQPVRAGGDGTVDWPAAAQGRAQADIVEQVCCVTVATLLTHAVAQFAPYPAGVSHCGVTPK